jgi:hypothetical protein
MNFSVAYLMHRALYRVYRFFYDWFIRSFLFTWKAFRAYIRSFEDVLAVRIQLRNLFQPLYQDYTVLGYVLGFIFRVMRVFMGVILYPIFLGVAVALYLIWVAIPFYIFYLGIV